MQIVQEIINLETQAGISIHNVTPYLEKLLAKTAIKSGQILVFSRHTTTANDEL
ncbi:MAG: hypothetical protein ACRDEA_18515 [Microcystaceae cyanobacterium]